MRIFSSSQGFEVRIKSVPEAIIIKAGMASEFLTPIQKALAGLLNFQS
ncbi:DEHA2A14784p [Debaryomyces hansenii CBS767]|jgi:hypothetical protein|uniref:DEHA2A14784p n=1 Tax=Debaryomyces hansenii (strain ATCC 36239 / CBS 767 / BCRC 21394 / JCM 1990 / NBRC 0083 / IGC 2968) TaxID=284592 RepID=Q6BXV0_DEBHA|nr:DEHA2A14784p [Debaryomyces hansenii CBS767]CAG84948.1 DEHA2A14784p [Debaryomyces hansenii CBS767]|eukprot:XP_456969.1 DEHA2A14784p [Debaryomyces hansenii CBS767]